MLRYPANRQADQSRLKHSILRGDDINTRQRTKLKWSMPLSIWVA